MNSDDVFGIIRTRKQLRKLLENLDAEHELILYESSDNREKELCFMRESENTFARVVWRKGEEEPEKQMFDFEQALRFIWDWINANKTRRYLIIPW